LDTSAIAVRLSAMRQHPAADEASVCEPRMRENYPVHMKFFISLAIAAVLAGIVYKVLTTEIPIDES